MGRGRSGTIMAAASAALLALSLGSTAATAWSHTGGSAIHAKNLLARTAGLPTGGRRPSLAPPRRPLASTPRLVGPVSDNVQVSPADNNLYSSTAAAYDPTDHANLYAAANMLSSTPVAGFRSSDAGLSWGMQPFPLPAVPPNRFGFYPGAAFDSSGTLYGSSLAYDVQGGYLITQVTLSKSLDKGKTWTTTSTVEPPSANAEKPLIAVDTTASPYRKRIYVAYDTNPGGYSEPLVVAHSDDGLTWARTQVFDSGGDFGASPAVGPNGEVYVAWDDWCGGRTGAGFCFMDQGQILLAKSTDGGATFTAAPVQVGRTPLVTFGAQRPNYSNGCNGAGPQSMTPAPSLDVDRSGGVHTGSLYAAWADMGADATHMHISFARSSDGGAHWSVPVQIDTRDYTKYNNDAWAPAVSVDQSNGAVTIAWYDRRDDPSNKLYRVYYTQSTDGGATFLTKQVPVSTAPSDPTLDCQAAGDYIQTAAVDGVAHPFWSDTRNGRNQIFTATIDEATLAQTLLPAPPLFAPRVSSPAHTSPYSLAAGDFNNDGKLDIAVGNTATSDVSILLGNGDGTFQAPINTKLPGDVGALAAGDLNKDGKLDLAVMTWQNNLGAISILPGQGDGTFGTSATFASGGGGPIAAADVNNDGNLDLVIPTGPTSKLTVFLGNGDGTFKAPIMHSTYGGSSFAVADFNGDGKLDVVLTGGPDSIVVVLGNGDGTFTAGTIYAAGAFPSAATVADFNGDGTPDIAVANYPQMTFSVLLNAGTGTFKPSVSYGGPNQQVSGIANGDFDGNGTKDLALTDPYGGVMIWLGRGDGTFSSAGVYAAGGGPSAIRAIDLNGDHRDDVVVANQYSNDVSSLVAVSRTADPQPTSLVFPDQVTKTMGPVRTVTVSNHGTADLHLATVDVKGPNARDFAKVGDTCSGAAISAGGNCTVSLRFTPTVVGSRVASLQVTDDAVGSPQLVPLNGAGLMRYPTSVPASPTSDRGIPPPPPTRLQPAAQPLRLFRLLLL